MARYTLCLIALVILSLAGCTKVDYSLESTAKAEPKSNSILIDASHDGGVWWFPQSGIYTPGAPHQGQELAELLRSKGFVVDELASYATVDQSVLGRYSKLIRVGNYGFYNDQEIEAYKKFLDRQSSLFFITEFLRDGQRDRLAESIGIEFAGIHYGYVDTYENHSITKGAGPFYFNAGSVVQNTGKDGSIQVLGWLAGDTQLPVMGILKHPRSKIFFLGEVNGLEGLPQPLTDNIIKWLFE